MILGNEVKVKHSTNMYMEKGASFYLLVVHCKTGSTRMQRNKLLFVVGALLWLGLLIVLACSSYLLIAQPSKMSFRFYFIAYWFT
jgi:hypothetical protein